MRQLATASTLAALALVLLFASGCGGLATQAPPPDARLDHDLAHPLFATDAATISDTDIARILDTRIELPGAMRVGLVHLDHRRREDGRRHDAGDRSRWPLVTEAFLPLGDHERIYDVSYVPRLMMPSRLTAGGLRATAARYQADWVLVFETGTEILTRDRILGTDRARAYCTAECVVLDVRTGLIAFSARAQVELEGAKSDDEWSLAETIGAVEQAAVEEAMAENVTALVRFLDRWRS
jgi:hypothetical protein